MAHIQTGIDERLASIAAHKDAIKSLETELAVMRMQHAASRTFSIAELLEAILAQLPPKDLLLLQRVSKDWKAAVASKEVQEKLFFRPISSQILDRSSYGDGKWRDIETQEEVQPKWNPLLEPLYDQLFLRVHTPQIEDLPTSAWQRPEASWRKMLRSQPPSRGVVTIRSNEDDVVERDVDSDTGRPTARFYEEDEIPLDESHQWGDRVRLEDDDITAENMLRSVAVVRQRLYGGPAWLKTFAYLRGFWREEEMKEASGRVYYDY